MRSGWAASCLEPSVLAAWCGGDLEDGQRHAVEAHVDRCSACGELLAAAGRVCASTTDNRIEVSAARNLGEDLLALSHLLDSELGPYRLGSVIGGGGLGLVFEAVDQRLGRRVAIKALRRAQAVTGALRHEAQALAALSHPHVVNVFDVLERGGREYLVMELVEGQTLRQWQVGRSPSEIVATYSAAASGLAAIHDAGLVHCDIKPDNILVSDGGRVLIADFGLAVLMDADGLVKRAPGGTPRYMSPEQRAGSPIGAASDQYGFCVSLNESLGGHAPAPLARLLRRGMHTTAARRWPSMRSLRSALIEAGGRRSRWGRWAGGLSMLAASLAAAAVLWPAPVAPAGDATTGLDLGSETRVFAALAQADMWRAKGDLLRAQGELARDRTHPQLKHGDALRLGLRHAQLLDYAGSRAEAGQELEQLELDATDAPDVVRAQIALELARTRPMLARTGNAPDWLETARARLLRAGIDPSQDIDARMVAATHQISRGDYPKALLELNAARELRTPRTPPMKAAALLERTAHVLDRLGRYDDADKTLTEATELLERHGCGHSDAMVLVLINRGNLQWFQDRKSEGIRTLERAIELGEHLQGSSPIELGRALSDLGAYQMQQGHNDAATKALLRAERLLPTHYVVQANLAILFGELSCSDASDVQRCKDEGQAKAYRYQLRAYELAREQLTAGHPSLSQIAGNLAYDYTQQGRYVLALQHYDEALDGLTAAYGERHIKLIRPLLGALEVAVRTDNQTSAARLGPWLRKASDAHKKALGPAAMSVIDYTLLRTTAWSSNLPPPDAETLAASIAFFGGHPPRDVGMVDTWFGPRTEVRPEASTSAPSP